MADLWGNEIGQAPWKFESSTHWKTRIFVILYIGFPPSPTWKLPSASVSSPQLPLWTKGPSFDSIISAIFTSLLMSKSFPAFFREFCVSFGHLLFNTRSWPLGTFRTVVRIYLDRKMDLESERRSLRDALDQILPWYFSQWINRILLNPPLLL